MPKRHPMKLKDFLKKMKDFGVVSMGYTRGKGSEIILLKPDPPGSNQGPQYPIKNHGSSTEIYIPVINSALRRFGIDPDEFY